MADTEKNPNESGSVVKVQRAEEITVEGGGGGFLIYASLCAISLTPEEAIFRFAARDPEDASKAVNLGTVYVSLPHAKRIAALLAKSLGDYEDKFGEIHANPLSQLRPEWRKRLGLDGAKDDQ